jgi:ABC-2 type transport system permease protein
MWWLLRHELRLSWRDWQAMVTAGNRRRFGTAIMILILVGAALHLPAYALVAHYGAEAANPGKAILITISVMLLLYSSLLLSQAMESVTRTLYSRGDLDLMLSSPVSPSRLFSVRIATNGLLIAVMALVLSAPLIDVLALVGGPRWLAGYAVSLSVGFAAAALAVAITMGLFRVLGPRRTRLVAQVLAAIIGASFAIGVQVIAILYYGSFAQRIFVASDSMVAHSPPEDSLLWLPARAVLGDPWSLTVVVVVAIGILALVIVTFAPRMGEHSIAATDLPAGVGRHRSRRQFPAGSPAAAMRRKEWRLLRRDPWLVSQTLTQLLYLLPPALLLARNFGQTTGILVVVVMVLVTVGGQLAGALAWLAISGEDAPELVRTAPVTAVSVTRAKVEAVMGAVLVMLGPLVVGLAFLSPFHAVAAAFGLALAAASTIRIQLWFRAQAKRSNFRRRHTSSRIATFGEALVSFSWAGAAGLAATGTWIAAFSVAVALIILAVVRSLSPRKAAI